MFLNMNPFYEDLQEHKKEAKGIDITIEKEEEIKEAIKNATLKGLKVEDVLVFKRYGKRAKFNKKAIDKLRENINLIKKPMNGKCFFIEGNTAEVSRNEEDGVCRYFSNNPRTNEFFYLDIVDIYVKMKDKPHGEAITDLLGAYHYYTNEETRKEHVRNIYRQNIRMINEINWGEYPIINKYLGVHKELLIIINMAGLKNVNGDAYFNNFNRPVFFASTRDLAKDYTISNSNIGKLIIIFALLGLIVKEKDVPENLLKNTKQINSNKKKKEGFDRELINYLSVRPLTFELLDLVEEWGNEMHEMDVRQGLINYDDLIEKVGIEITDSVYPNGRQIRKRGNKMKIYEKKEYYSFGEVVGITGYGKAMVNRCINRDAELKATGDKGYLPDPTIIGTQRHWSMEDIRIIEKAIEDGVYNEPKYLKNTYKNNSYGRLKRKFLELEAEYAKLRETKELK